MKKTSIKFWFILLLTFVVTINAQQSSQSSITRPTVKTYKLDSKLMQRQIPYNVVLPVGYEDDKTVRFPVIYLLHGLSGSYNDSLDTSRTDSPWLDYLSKYRFIIVTPEGGRGFFTDSATNPNDRYESYIIQELIPEVDKNFRTIAESKGRAIAGASMGGYGALKFGVKYPQMFALAASWIGAVNVASWRSEQELLSMPAAKIIPNIKQILLPVFGDGTKSTLAENDLFKIFADLPQDIIAGLPFFYLDSATEDELQLLKPNQQLAELMLNRKIPHEYRQYPGTHRLQLWLIPDLLSLCERIFNSQKRVSNK